MSSPWDRELTADDFVAYRISSGILAAAFLIVAGVMAYLNLPQGVILFPLAAVIPAVVYSLGYRNLTLVLIVLYVVVTLAVLGFAALYLLQADWTFL